MAIMRMRPSALAAFASVLLILASSAPAALAFDKVEFAWPFVGNLKLDITGTSDVTFAETVQFTTKMNMTLTLNAGGWRHNLAMSYVLKNGNLPEEDLIKVGELGLYLERWRLVSTYDKLTVTAGETAAPNMLTGYMSSSALYGATIQVGGDLPGALKDVSYSLAGMGGKNSASRGISSTTMDVAGLGLELQYLRSVKLGLSFVEGIREGTDANVGSANLAYMFETGSVVLDGALSLEEVSGDKGWFASVSYSDYYAKKAALTTNISYTSSRFNKVSPVGPPNGGTISASAGLNLQLTPAWKGSESLSLKARYSKDNLEDDKPTSVQSYEAGVTYSASGFAPLTLASASYTLSGAVNDLEPRTVDSVKHQIDLKYSNQQMINKTRLTVNVALSPSVSLDRATDNLNLAMASTASASLFMSTTTITGKAEMKVAGNRNTGTMTFAPSLDLTVNTSFKKPAITIAATLKVSNSSTLKYTTGIITNDVSYLDLAPSVTWKVSDSVSIYAKYAGKLRFGSTVPSTTWTDVVSTGISFRL